MGQDRRQLGGHDRLAHVTLRMFRDVGKQADHGGGQALTAHRPRVGKRRRVRRPDNRFGIAEGVVQGGQKVLAGRLSRGFFRRHGVQLRRRQFLP